MGSYGHLSSRYTQLLSAIHEAGGAPCEDSPEMFYPEDIANQQVRNISIKIAKQTCAECPVKLSCFEFALETNQRHGIWGGTLPSERL